MKPLIVHAHTTPEAFLGWLRDAACQDNMPTQYIDCIDHLLDLQDELYEKDEYIEDLKYEIGELRAKLARLAPKRKAKALRPARQRPVA
jgi:hypothetical protein